MGFREWRERQLARADALTAKADTMDAELKRAAAARRVEREDARAALRADPLRPWFEVEAARLGEDHDALAARAAAVGMGLPAPRRDWAGSLNAHVGVLMLGGADVSDAGGGRRDPYREWRDRIRVEERCAAKVALGESLSWLDRESLRMARFLSK